MRNPAEDHASTEPEWDGDGTVEVQADDSEWGSDAPASNASSQSGDDFGGQSSANQTSDVIGFDE